MTNTRKSKTPRSLRLLAWTKAATTGGFIAVTEGKKTDKYEIAEIRSDFGRGFKIQKFAVVAGAIKREDSYEVNVGESSQCGCMGFSRFAYCRHTEAIKTLIQCGKI